MAHFHSQVKIFPFNIIKGSSDINPISKISQSLLWRVIKQSNSIIFLPVPKIFFIYSIMNSPREVIIINRISVQSKGPSLFSRPVSIFIFRAEPNGVITPFNMFLLNFEVTWVILWHWFFAHHMFVWITPSSAFSLFPVILEGASRGSFLVPCEVPDGRHIWLFQS